MTFRARVALLIVWTCWAGVLPARETGGDKVRILFIGNSLTFANELPRMVARIGDAAGRTIEVRSIAFPNYSLEDHLREGRVQKALQRESWDFVVLQQGPSSLAESRSLLIRDAGSIARLVDGTRTRIALYTVWPARNRMQDFPRVVESYRLAAESVGGVSIPGGEHWRTLLRDQPDLALYGSDGFHPTPAGSYVAALTVYRSLVGPLPPMLLERKAAERVAGVRLAITESQLQAILETAGKPSR